VVSGAASARTDDGSEEDDLQVVRALLGEHPHTHSALLAALGDAELQSELGHSVRSSCSPPTPSSSSTFQCELDALRARKSTLQGELEDLGVQLAASSVSMETASSALQDRQRAATGAFV